MTFQSTKTFVARAAMSCAALALLCGLSHTTATAGATSGGVDAYTCATPPATPRKSEMKTTKPKAKKAKGKKKQGKSRKDSGTPAAPRDTTAVSA